MVYIVGATAQQQEAPNKETPTQSVRRLGVLVILTKCASKAAAGSKWYIRLAKRGK